LGSGRLDSRIPWDSTGRILGFLPAAVCCCLQFKSYSSSCCLLRFQAILEF
jgi:hypothetical protein